MEYQHVAHPFSPIWDESSRILILGTLPSVQSRRNAFYYGHPQNRFWRLVSALVSEPVPIDMEEKRALLLRHHIALWDVIASCDICGSSDQSIRNAVPTDLNRILKNAPIAHIYANGSKAGKLYQRYQQSITGLPITVLPSTSPANAAWTLERLREEWKVMLEFLPAGE